MRGFGKTDGGLWKKRRVRRADERGLGRIADPRFIRSAHAAFCVSGDVGLLLAIGVMAGAADLHHVNLGRVLALFAAILAVLRRGAAASLTRALSLFLVSHLEHSSSFESLLSGCCLPLVSTRNAAKVKPKVRQK
jgi:hypothetical protein